MCSIHSPFGWWVVRGIGPSACWNWFVTLLGTKISPTKAPFEDDFPFPVWWDMLVLWRVIIVNPEFHWSLGIAFSFVFFAHAIDAHNIAFDSDRKPTMRSHQRTASNLCYIRYQSCLSPKQERSYTTTLPGTNISHPKAVEKVSFRLLIGGIWYRKLEGYK